MTGYRMVFDRENLKLGWSRSDCEYQFLITYVLVLSGISYSLYVVFILNLKEAYFHTLLLTTYSCELRSWIALLYPIRVNVIHESFYLKKKSDTRSYFTVPTKDYDIFAWPKNTRGWGWGLDWVIPKWQTKLFYMFLICSFMEWRKLKSDNTFFHGNTQITRVKKPWPTPLLELTQTSLQLLASIEFRLQTLAT